MYFKARTASKSKGFLAKPLRHALAGMALAGAGLSWAQAPAASGKAPVLIGFDGAYGQKTNTAPIAIELGARAAIDEINRAGGVLGGRPLKLVTTDNKGVTARGKDNFIELAQMTDLIAVMGGKYSPVSVEVLPEAHRLKVPLVSVWGSADGITDHAYRPSYTFRVSLKDEWGVEAMMRRMASTYKATQACAFLPNTSWGRSADAVIKSKAARYKLNFGVVRWYNWGDTSFAEEYRHCLDNQGQTLMFVGNEKEATILLKEMAALPADQRLPVVAHWGTVGGLLHEMAGPALGQVTFDVIQTFSFLQSQRPRAKTLSRWIQANSPYKTDRAIPSPVGAAHAYDTVHLLALAVERARSTQGSRVRDALEKLPPFSGAVRDYKPAFSATRHDALDANQVLFVRVGPDGTLTPTP
jgi:branched-chain amino acid transport system substrate-binding protein